MNHLCVCGDVGEDGEGGSGGAGAGGDAVPAGGGAAPGLAGGQGPPRRSPRTDTGELAILLPPLYQQGNYVFKDPNAQFYDSKEPSFSTSATVSIFKC
jgi:hypothetical protein